MAKVTDVFNNRDGKPVIFSDFSPPRGSSLEFLEDARGLAVDFLTVAYNPGKAVRIDSAMMAAAIKWQAGRDAIFNLATRDMNKLALQSHLLGAAALGLENVLVVGGDTFSAKDLERVKPVDDFRPTELIKAIADMNAGLDFRSLKLRQPTDLCIGGAIDLGRGVEEEARLTYKKALAGAHFFVTQPVFYTQQVEQFNTAYKAASGQEIAQPVFWGLQLMVKDGVIFASVPQAIRRELESGRDGVEMAVEQWLRFRDASIDAFYLVPPILKGGARDYDAARRFLQAVGR
jgi:5,10-methylenetetrahydrofolate reductase